MLKEKSNKLTDKISVGSDILFGLYNLSCLVLMPLPSLANEIITQKERWVCSSKTHRKGLIQPVFPIKSYNLPLSNHDNVNLKRNQ